ncbi:MAG TPA: phosphate ABC transporter substrate-binding protein [Candidatus Merdivicinus intestinigallinarum]|nr:phosphate ABC transporter substrate-binding protein [Candidatus Merdivicinus intestinigallinarum]
MKKMTSVLMAGLFAAMTLASCGGDGASSSSTESSAPESSAATESSASAEASTETTELSGTVSMSGSTSMEIVAKALAESFTALYPDVTVDVQLGGSSTGIQNALEGVSDIGNVSRDLAEDETGLTPHEIALDGIGIAVNPENPVENLTLEQIAGIYTGEITNWSEVGGEDLEIYVVGREAGSGTRDAFESIVGVEDVAAYDSEQTSTGSAKTTVATTPGAIGYVSFDSIDDTVKTVTVNDVAISLETIQDGSYVLQRPFLMVTKEGAELSEAVQAFLDYTLSDEGQAVCEQVGLVPVK